MCVALGIIGLVHGPGDDSRVVKVRVVPVRELESPTAARKTGAARAPVSVALEQLQRLEPFERTGGRGERRGAARLLHREAGQGGIPDR